MIELCLASVAAVRRMGRCLRGPVRGMDSIREPGMTQPLTLPKARRIRRSGEFRWMQSAGRRLVLGCLILNWKERGDGSAGRLGVVTSGRLGGAVIRSRARRLLRESYRLHQHQLMQPVDMILVARASVRGMNLARVERDLLAAWRRAGLLAAPV